MTHIKGWFIISGFILSFSLATACGEVKKDIDINSAIAEGTATTTAPVTSAGSTSETIAAGQQQVSESFIVMSADNVSELKVGNQFFPFYPPIGAVSGNQSVIAVGTLAGVRILDATTQELIMEINTELPDCQFGWEAYLALDHSGNFVAITTKTGIEVWQVGGGLIYQSPYQHGKSLDRLTCGADIPQIALSPQGLLLAESGLSADGIEYGDYFQVIDILKNEVVYAWDGSVDQPHGQLQTFPELGFSADGMILQTFDPALYQFPAENSSQAFRFWSTQNWTAVDRSSDSIIDSVDPGALMHAVSLENTIYLYDKTSGAMVIEVDWLGCSREFPCEVIFSSDGGTFAVLERSDSLYYRRKPLITDVSVYSIKDGSEISTSSVLLRQKNSIFLQNDGGLVFARSTNEAIPTWWTNTAYLNGFFVFDHDHIGFIPQVLDVFADASAYSGTCLINTSDDSLVCQPGILPKPGEVIAIEEIENGFVLNANNERIAQVKYPPGGAGDSWQVRYKAYHSETGVGYFCLDRNQREETCVIMNFLDNTILAEKIDLFGFISSPDNYLAAFINRATKELVIFQEMTGRMTRMQSYQAVAFPVKPALLPDNSRAIYLVESEAEKDLFIEEISLVNGKVIKRYTFDGLSAITPTSIAAHPFADLWAVGDENGKIHLLDEKTSEIIYTIDAAGSGVVDMIFSADGKQLFVMEESGVISALRISQ